MRFNFNFKERRSGDGVKYSALESRFFGDVFKSSLDNDLSGYDGKFIILCKYFVAKLLNT